MFEILEQLPEIEDIKRFVMFVGFDSIHPSQQFFSYVGTGLPGLNQ